MKIKTLALLAFVFITAHGCVSVLTGERGNGNVVTEERSIGAFHEMELSGGFDVELVKSNKQVVKITTDDNLMDNVETYVRGETLHVKSRNIGEASELVVVIHYRDLDNISTSGAIEIRSQETLEADKLSIEASGASEVYLDLDVEHVSFDLSGASEIELTGSAEEIIFDGSGACELRAYDLSAKKAEIQISGAGKANVNASKSLNASASGAGDIHYRGRPEQIQTNVSGAGSISPE